MVRLTAQARVRETDDLGFVDDRPVAVTIFYFPSTQMEGDIDNIVKPILDALIGVAYLNDRQVERVVAQKFEPGSDLEFDTRSETLAAAMDARRPIVYVRVDDDLRWRKIP